jgi:L-lysine 2,3-aminomutase
LSQTITKPEVLFAALGLDAQLLPAARAANETFALRVPAPFLARIKPGDPDDPLLRQVLPVADELAERAGYVADPLEEGAAKRAPGLLQKYAGRALLITTAACAIHCRYCFRREFPYADQAAEETALLFQPAFIAMAFTVVEELSVNGAV